jgi:hypothetical protein
MRRSERDFALNDSRADKRGLQEKSRRTKDETSRLTSGTHIWTYVPDTKLSPNARKLRESFISARRDFVEQLAYEHFRALKEHFRDLIDNAENDCLHLIWEAVREAVSHDIDSIMNDPNELTWPVTIDLVTRPLASGYELRVITFHKQDGLEGLVLADLP